MTPDQSAGPDYRELAAALLHAAGELAHAVGHNRPEAMGMSPATGPEVIIDLWRLRCTVALRLTSDRVAVLDEFSLDPKDADFGISKILNTPHTSSGSGGTWH